jgi:putative endonuclease
MGISGLGAIGEQVAVRHLERAGFVVVDRNWRCAEGGVRGEIDIVATEGDVLVFVEVKARRGTAAGAPLEALTPQKILRLRRLAGVYLARSGCRPPQVRLDAVGVCWRRDGRPPEVLHVRDLTG